MTKNSYGYIFITTVVFIIKFILKNMPRINGTGSMGQGRGVGRGLGVGGGVGIRAGRGRPQGQARKLDGTGPLGQGPRTGRGLGNCATPDKKD